MPETLKGLWKQRLRWAQGGAEVFLKNMTRLWRKENFRMWPLFFEYCLTTIWAFTCPGRFHYLRSPTCRCTVKY